MLKVDEEERRVRAMVKEAMRDLVLHGTPDLPVAEAAQATVHPSEYTVATYLEGGLTGSAEEVFERHVAFCPSCAQELVLARRGGVARADTAPRRLWKLAASIALVLAGLGSAVLGGRALGDRVENAALARLRSAFGDRAHIENVSLSLRGGPAVDLSGLTVRDPQGGEPMLTASSASFGVDVGALAQGDLKGTLRLDQPVISIVRDPSGRVNVDALLPHAVGAEDIFSIASKRAVHHVEIAGGTIRIVDRVTGQPREIRMASVDAELHGLGEGTPVHLDAKAGFESTKHNVAVQGDVGPWGRGETPSYALDRVALNSVPLRAFPQVGSVIGGGLTFEGRLATKGETWNDITSRVSGGGEMSVVSGAITGHNFVARVVGPVLDHAEAPGRLGAIFTAKNTPFDRITSPVTIADSHLSATSLELAANGYEVSGRGSIDMNGRVAFTGRLDVSSELSREMVAMAPLAGALVNDDGEISVPFSLSGTWPNVQTTVDVERFAADTILRRIASWLWLSLGRPLLG